MTGEGSDQMLVSGPKTATPLRGMATRRTRTLLGNDSGAALLEFAFLTPILVLLLAGIVQFGMVIFLRSSMQDVAQDAVRRMAVGEFTTALEVSTHVGNTFSSWVTPSVTAAWPNVGAGETDVSLTLSVALSDAVPFDLLGLFKGETMPVVAVMRQEAL